MASTWSNDFVHLQGTLQAAFAGSAKTATPSGKHHLAGDADRQTVFAGNANGFRG